MKMESGKVYTVVVTNQIMLISNQITTLQIKFKSTCSQINSSDVIQSRFKSNHDLDLPITVRDVARVRLGEGECPLTIAKFDRRPQQWSPYTTV